MDAWEPLAFEDPRAARALARMEAMDGTRVRYRLPEGFSLTPLRHSLAVLHARLSFMAS